MSFSVAWVGTPSGIKKKLAEYIAKQTGGSQMELIEAQPHMEGLLAMNHAEAGAAENLIIFSANGHANYRGGEKLYGSISFKIESLPGTPAF